MSVALVWAQSADGYIGVDGGLPWHLPEDLTHFRGLTTGHPVIMGRATWDSLPERFRPLPGRDNIVLSRSGAGFPGALVAHDVDSALALVAGRDAWVIGGAQVYAAFLPVAQRLEVTEVDVDVAGDTRAPSIGPAWAVVARDPDAGWHLSSTGLRYRFRTLVRGPGDGGTSARGPGPGR